MILSTSKLLLDHVKSDRIPRNSLAFAVLLLLLWGRLRWARAVARPAIAGGSKTRSSICSRRNTAAACGSLSSLGGALGLRGSALSASWERMQTQGLIKARGQEFGLTPEGERLALQVVRAHRLLERYFADEARLPLPPGASGGRTPGTPALAGRPPIACRPRWAIPRTIRTAIRFRRAKARSRRRPARPPRRGPTDALGRIVHLEDEPQIRLRRSSRKACASASSSACSRPTPSVSLHDRRRARIQAGAGGGRQCVPGWPPTEPRGPNAWSGSSDLPTISVAEVVALDEACQGFIAAASAWTSGSRKARASGRTCARLPAIRARTDVRGTTIALRRDRRRRCWSVRWPIASSRAAEAR